MNKGVNGVPSSRLLVMLLISANPYIPKIAPDAPTPTVKMLMESVVIVAPIQEMK